MLGAAASLKTGWYGSDVQRAAVRAGQAALRALSDQLRLAGGARGDANSGAIVLFILWVYYTAIVFLLGAVVAETWELKKMLDSQRAGSSADRSKRGRSWAACHSHVGCI